jgi:hypothetical protein
MQKVILIVLIVCSMMGFVYLLSDVIHAPYWFCNVAAISESVVFAIGMFLFSRREYRR